MFDDPTGLPLTVTIPVDELAYLKRRAQYLEAVMLQVLRDHAALREWFPAAELAALKLPGLPHSKAGLAKLASSQSWRRRRTTGQGGSRYEYHVTALPPRAFDHLIGLIVGTVVQKGAIPPPQVPEAPLDHTSSPPSPTPTPPWLLPLMRLVKKGRMGTLTDICTALPKTLPEGVPAPTREEVAKALRRLGFTA